MFDSAKEKIRWANEHLEAFETSIQRFFENPANALGVKKRYYPKTQHFLWYVANLAEIHPDWPLMLGDIAHSYRATLDHMAWELVGLGSDPEPSDPNKVGYPIFSKPASFRKHVGEKLPGVLHKQWAPIEQRQPYRGRDEIETLRSLSNDDKHRAIKLVFVVLGELETSFGPSDFRDFGLTVIQPQSLRRPLKVGTKLYRFCGQALGPNPDMDMQLKAKGAIAIDNGPEVLDFLDAIRIYVAEVLAAVEREI